MAVLTKSQIHQFNRKMLGLGAPVVIDGVGYNKFDFSKMVNFADYNPNDFTNRQTWFIALTLGHYKNTQLKAHKQDIEDTINYYKSTTDKKVTIQGKQPVRVVGTSSECVDIVWEYNQQVSNALKGQLDRSQYHWKKINNTWVLSINWGYLNEICQAFTKLNLDVSELYTAKPPVEQLTLFNGV